MKRKLHHHSLDLPFIKELSNRVDLEVWVDTPDDGEPPHLTLYLSDDTRYVDLTPNEARALAAILINGADWQDRHEAEKLHKF